MALPPVAGTLTRGLARFARILAHISFSLNGVLSSCFDMDVYMSSDIKVDILFAGLLIIPVVILGIPYVQKKLNDYVRNKPISVLPLPIAVYLVYDISMESNIFGKIGLFVGFCVFFFTYAASVSLLASTIKTRKAN